MFRRLVLVLFACVAPLLLALAVEAPLFATGATIEDVAAGAADCADADGSGNGAEPGPEAVEDDVPGFEPTAVRAPADPRQLVSYDPREAVEPRPPGKAVLTRPPV